MLYPEYIKTAGFPQQHIEIFKQCSQKNRMVISSRALNPASTDLLLEGYAAKGFHIKAKTCDWGPAAGFVPFNPLFTKAGQSFDTQEAAIKQACSHGARSIPLVISMERVKKLKKNGAFDIIQGCMADQIMKIVAHFSTQEKYAFILVKQPDAQHWAICYSDAMSAFLPSTELIAHLDTAGYKPVEGLTNPRKVDALDFKSAVCGDYDLWCIFPHSILDAPGINDRSLLLRATLTSHAQQLSDNIVFHRAHQAGLIFANDDEKIEHMRRLENKNLGNISHAVNRIRRELNLACRPGGGEVVMHGDYGGYLFGTIDFPLIFFIPDQEFQSTEVHITKNINELKEVLKYIRLLGYRTDLNPAWNLRF